MTKIKKLAKQIDEELCGAKHYAEKYVEYKSENNSNIAQKYKTMADDELKHATWLHDMAVTEILRLKDSGLQPTQKMEKAWDESHKEYVEKESWIKTMLAM